MAVVGTPPANHNFETPAITVGTPPTNHDMTTAAYASGAPANYDFETGTLSGWMASGTVSVQSNATQGYYASLGASGVLTTSAFTVTGETQQLAVAIGYLHPTSTSYVEFYVHSGANYATQSKIATLFCLNCGWRQEAFDLTAYAGQSIQLRFKRTGGTIGVDAPRTMVMLPAYTTTGVAERASEGDGNVFALLRSGAAIVSSPFTVASDAQQLTLRLSGRSTSSDYYTVRILSSAAYTVSTQVAYDTVEDSWRTVEFDLTAWRGQSVRLRLERAGGVIGVDDRPAGARDAGWLRCAEPHHHRDRPGGDDDADGLRCGRAQNPDHRRRRAGRGVRLRRGEPIDDAARPAGPRQRLCLRCGRRPACHGRRAGTHERHRLRRPLSPGDADQRGRPRLHTDLRRGRAADCAARANWWRDALRLRQPRPADRRHERARPEHALRLRRCGPAGADERPRGSAHHLRLRCGGPAHRHHRRAGQDDELWLRRGGQPHQQRRRAGAHPEHQLQRAQPARRHDRRRGRGDATGL